MVDVTILRRKYGGCIIHGPFQYDDDLTYVECRTCGEKINPMKVIGIMCRQESKYRQLAKTYSQMRKDLNARKRVKCEHCRKFTRIKGVKGVVE